MKASPFMLILLLVLVLPTSVRADGKTNEKALKLVKHLSRAMDVVELLDEVTKTKGEITLKSAGKPIAERTFFGVEFLVPNVEFEDYVTSAAFGKEIPGRRVTVTMCVDCDVECRIDLGKIKVVRHEEYEDTTVIVIPPMELIGRVPEGRKYDYTVSYGKVRSKWLWLDSGAGRAVRSEMETKVANKAAEDFAKSDLMNTFRKDFKRELRANIKPSVPSGRRIDIKFGEE